MTPLADTSELLLQCCRYLSGELEPAEGEAFERLLSADQSARDLLAEAVLLQAAVHQLAAGRLRPAPGVVAAGEPASQSRSWRSVLLGITSLALTIAVAALLVRQSEELPGSPPVASDAVRTARLWVSLERGEGILPDVSDADEAEGHLTLAEVPGWMFSAVEAGTERSRVPDAAPSDDDDEGTL